MTRTPRPNTASALKLVDAATPQTFDQLVEEAQALDRSGRSADARAHFEAAMNLLSEPDPVRASMLLRWIALSFERESDYVAAEDAAEAAIAVAETSGDEATLAYAMNIMGVVRFRQGALASADEHLGRALVYGARGSDPRVLSHAHTNLGTIASVRGDFREAVRHFEEALAIGRLHASPENLLPTLINIGVTNLALARLDDADEAFSEATTIAEALGILSRRVLIDINRASLEIARERYDVAERLCDSAMGLAEHLEDPLSRGEAQKLYGIIARETSQFAKAETHLREANRIAAELANFALEGEASRELAELYSRMGRNREMLQALNRARACFDQLRSRHEMADVARRMTRLEGDFLDVARDWGESIESKDLHTQGHCERVADLATALAGKVGFDEGTLFWFRIGALLHDVGKLIIPPEVLNKPGKLSDDEWTLVKRHPTAGVDMLADVEFPWDIAPMVRSHHERWDGRGYPEGLRSNDIPMPARILCIADVYDALTSARSYKPPFTQVEAMEIMRRDVGTQFDPELFPIFEELVRNTTSLTSDTRTLTPASRAKAVLRKAGAEEDDLTGALLRRPFIDVATAVLAERRRTNGVTSLLVIDVDHFKNVNDTYGHLAGDEALRTVVGVTRQVLRPGQYVGRYAGDEFVVLLPDVDAQGALQVGGQILAALNDTRIRRHGSESFGITLSIGAATAPHDASTFETLFAEGDRALFKSKRDGRNRVAIAGESDGHVAQISFARFVGRNEELRTLVQALDLAGGGSPQLRLVVGEAGVGKSTLLRQLAPELRLRGVASVDGRSFESVTPTPLAPWTDLVAGIDSKGMTPAGEWPMLARLVPSLVADGGNPSEFDSAQTHRLLRELVRFLRQVASIRPLVLVLEDIQWADSASWDALEYVMAQLTTERICVFVTMRSEEAATGPLRERGQRLSRDERAAELPLDRLTSADISEILQKGMHRAEVDEQLHDFVMSRTEGNPFLVMQLLGAMVEEGLFIRGDNSWACTLPSALRLPKSMTDLVGRRLNRLKPETMRVLAYAAAVGRAFSLGFVAEAAHLSWESVLDAVDDALDAAVIQPPADERDDAYQFAHTLLVDAVLRTINAPRRRAAHERIGDLLSEKTPSAINAIASQYARSSNRTKAYAACRRAAAKSLDLYALDEARSFLELALASATTEPEQMDVHDSLARVAELSGRWGDVEQACDRLLASPVIHALPAKALSARLRRLQARFRLGLGAQDVEAECRELVSAAEDSGSLNEIVQTRGLLVQLLARKGEVAEAVSFAEETRWLAEAAGNEAIIADAMYRSAITLNSIRPVDAMVMLQDLIVRAKARGDRLMEARAYLALGVARSRTDDDVAGADAFRTAFRLAQAAQALDVAASASMNLGVIELRNGAFDNARASLTEALRFNITLQNNANRLVALYNLANVERENNTMDEAVRLYRETVQLATSLGVDDVLIGAHAGVGLASLRLGRLDDASISLDRALARFDGRDEWWFQGRELLEALSIRMLVVAGDYTDAHRRFLSAVARLEDIEEYARAWLVSDCAGLLADPHPDVWSIIRRHALIAQARGFHPISARFTALRDQVERAVQL